LGRLFWKFIFAFWLAFAAISATIATTVWLIQQTHSQSFFWGDRKNDFSLGPARFMLDTAASILSSGPASTMRSTLLVWSRNDRRPGPSPVLYVVDDQGRDLLGRPVPSLRSGGDDEPLVRKVTALDGHVYTLFLTRDLPPLPPPVLGMPGFYPSPPPPPPMAHVPPAPPFITVIASLFFSLGFSAWLAWYVAKPIRILRWAFRAAAEGKLDTRVHPKMGRRRDEIADLGRDFDRMATQLQKQIGAQQRLLHDVSHELRSPLARLQAAIGLARQNPRRIDMTLERIELESGRLDALVGEVLTLARMESGVKGAAHEQVDLIELLTMIVDDAQFEAQVMQRNVSFSGEGAFVLDCMGELLYRSFENVIRNAVKYTRENTTVEVRAVASADALSVVVADQGYGVPPGSLETIFEPFYRTGNSGATQGFGLGLAIARRAVESHGGRVWAELGQAGGLVVHFTIPRVSAAPL
jgi:two-component system OmpR family sensor kinase